MSLLVDGELVLYGPVGFEFDGVGFTSGQVVVALAEVGRDADVSVRINSGGGFTDDGIAIFNALKAHGGKVTVIVDAMAASAASLIAMAGDEIIMRQAAQMMIHGPSGGVWGKAHEMEAYVNASKNIGRGMAEIYAEKSGDDVEALLEEMKGEIWLTGAEAVARGFATSEGDTQSSNVTAFDFRQYADAPQKLVALAASSNWNAAAMQPNFEAVQKENPNMAKPTQNAPAPAPVVAGAPAPAPVVAEGDEKGRIRAILTSDAGKAMPNLAENLAYEGDMTAEAAIALLAAADVDRQAVGAPDAPQVQANTYQAGRVNAADLAKPVPVVAAGGAEKPKINTDGIYTSRRNAGSA